MTTTTGTAETAAVTTETGAGTAVETATMTDAATTGIEGTATVMIDETTATAMTAEMIARNQHPMTPSSRCSPIHAVAQSAMTETGETATTTAITIAGEIGMLADLDSRTGRSRL